LRRGWRVVQDRPEARWASSACWRVKGALTPLEDQGRTRTGLEVLGVDALGEEGVEANQGLLLGDEDLVEEDALTVGLVPELGAVVVPDLGGAVDVQAEVVALGGDGDEGLLGDDDRSAGGAGHDGLRALGVGGLTTTMHTLLPQGRTTACAAP
jgi:hypothetical protein